MEAVQKEQTLTWAKNHIAEHGDMSPMLHVFGDKGDVVVLCQFDSPESKCKGMFELGQRVITDKGLSSDVGTPKEIAFLGTAWYISIPADNLKDVEIGMVAPSQDPDRKEALMLVMSDGKGKADCEMFKINRDGKVVSFEAIGAGEEGRFESNITDLFWEGVASVAKDDAFSDDVIILAMALSSTRVENFSSDKDRIIAAGLAAHTLVIKRLGKTDIQEVTKLLYGVLAIAEPGLVKHGVLSKTLCIWADSITKAIEEKDEDVKTEE